ncbi:MAG: PEP-CTERM sorting domain-containing protein [Verrucomicrobia bacterium]|nr:PEP-CTERM sorting domain-containing protein [Verrucomicrobiota bacterium]
MKKLILSTTFLIAGTLGILAQGLVTFDNGDWNFSDGLDRNVYISEGVLLDNATYQAGLFENRAGTWTQLGALCSFDFGGVTLPGIWAWDGATREVSVAKGVATELQVRIFDGGGALLGESPPFAFTHANNAPALPTDTLMINFRSFVVPEPSSIALGVLGLGALLLFRRRK